MQSTYFIMSTHFTPNKQLNQPSLPNCISAVRCILTSLGNDYLDNNLTLSLREPITVSRSTLAPLRTEAAAPPRFRSLLNLASHLRSVHQRFINHLYRRIKPLPGSVF
jgi:hypothetical protein